MGDGIGIEGGKYFKNNIDEIRSRLYRKYNIDESENNIFRTLVDNLVELNYEKNKYLPLFSRRRSDLKRTETELKRNIQSFIDNAKQYGMRSRGEVSLQRLKAPSPKASPKASPKPSPKPSPKESPKESPKSFSHLLPSASKARISPDITPIRDSPKKIKIGTPRLILSKRLRHQPALNTISLDEIRRNSRDVIAQSLTRRNAPKYFRSRKQIAYLKAIKH